MHIFNRTLFDSSLQEINNSIHIAAPLMLHSTTAILCHRKHRLLLFSFLSIYVQYFSLYSQKYFFIFKQLESAAHDLVIQLSQFSTTVIVNIIKFYF